MVNRANRKTDIVKPVFVETIPADLTDLQAGTLYISMKYNTLVHRCPCGCGGLSEVGLDPATRKLIYDGQRVSIEPSIGVRTLPCRSHYWITENQIVWAKPISKDMDKWYDKKRHDLTHTFEGGASAWHSIEDKRWWFRLMHKVEEWLRRRRFRK
ncbi:MAG: DUF6527 family protein [Aestuariivita sp.]|nr:DUF6527 family protein [Aestuariivita sp.]